nr:T9SS type A sorting domain-containing protein [uncultured Flavobacterium sp.]
MKKNYFYIIILTAIFFTTNATAQDNKQPKTQQDASIEGLNLYPNPVATGKIYITSTKELEKDIIIFDVLGKKALQTKIFTKELNIANLSPGVYIIQITEEGSTSSRKLIVQ